jgi:hypothetical protein
MQSVREDPSLIQARQKVTVAEHLAGSDLIVGSKYVRSIATARAEANEL